MTAVAGAWLPAMMKRPSSDIATPRASTPMRTFRTGSRVNRSILNSQPSRPRL